MKEIKRINKISLAKITALIYGLIGFFIALIVAILTMSNIMTNKDFSGSVLLITLFNLGAGLLLGILSAIFTAIIGCVIGFTGAGIYNWFSRKAGGIKIELADDITAAKEAERDDTANAVNNQLNN